MKLAVLWVLVCAHRGGRGAIAGQKRQENAQPALKAHLERPLLPTVLLDLQQPEPLFVTLHLINRQPVAAIMGEVKTDTESKLL